MGFGKGSSTSSVQMTPEQQELLKAQTNFLTQTAFPAYQETIGGAKDVLKTVQPYAYDAAKAGFGAAGNVGQTALGAAGEQLRGAGSTLGQLFDPQYERNQIQAALQAGREATREQLGQQNAMYGAAGGLGSARHALADENLAQLAEQRQATAAAGAQAQVQQNRLTAAQTGLQAAQGLASTGMGAYGQQVQLAQVPQDIYAKYASVVYGTPQQSTTPMFQGTQGQSTSSKGFGGSMKW